MQGIFRKENTDKALKYGIYRHLPTYEKIIRNLVSFWTINSSLISIIAISSFFLSSAMELLHPFAVKKIVRNSHMNILLTSAICPICYYCSIISVNHFLFHIKLSPPTLNHFTDASKMVYSSFSLSLS